VIIAASSVLAGRSDLPSADGGCGAAQPSGETMGAPADNEIRDHAVNSSSTMP